MGTELLKGTDGCIASWDAERGQCLLAPDMQVLGRVEQTWQAEEMAGMVGKLVTLSDLIKPISKYIEDNSSQFSH